MTTVPVLTEPCAASGPLAGPGPRSASSWLLARGRPSVLVATAVVLALGAGALGAVKLTYAIAVVAGFGLVLAVLLRPFVGGIILAAVVPAVSGLAPGIPVRYVRISELLIGAVGVTILVSTRRRDRLAFEVLDWLLLCYGVAWALFGVYDALTIPEHLSLSLWGTALGQLQFFLLYRGIRLTVRTPDERRRAVRAVLVAAGAVSVLALAQEAHVPGLDRFLLKITGAPVQPGGHLLRATGPFDNWAALAGYLLPLVLLLVAFALGDVRLHRPRRAVLVLGLVLVALLTTVELSAIFCLLVCLVWLGARYGKVRTVAKRAGLGLLVCGLVASPLIAKKIHQELAKTAGVTRASLMPQTISFRMGVWSQQYLPAIGQRPEDGYGVVLPSSIAWPYPESQYIALLIEGGAPMLVVFVGLTVASMERSARAGGADDPFDAALGHALLVTGGALIAMDAIWPYVSNGGTPQMLWSLLALAAPGWASVGRRPASGRPLALPGETAGRLVVGAARP